MCADELGRTDRSIYIALLKRVELSIRPRGQNRTRQDQMNRSARGALKTAGHSIDSSTRKQANEPSRNAR
jgi:hypothetical protein